jgi:hypothetical protein
MPGGFVGDVRPLFAASRIPLRGVSDATSSASLSSSIRGAGVPKSALLIARTAKTGAGVSGGSGSSV